MSLNDNYEVGMLIGQGSYSNVFIAKHKLTKQDVAIKFVNKEGLNTARSQREIQIAMQIKHPFVAETFEVYDVGDEYAVVMEYLEGGSLLQHINAVGAIAEPAAKRFFKQMVVGLKYLHEQGITHRDIKVENILLSKEHLIKYIDFGLSAKLQENMKTPCGSPNYAAPEIIRGLEYNSSVDVWSLGVILFCLVHGRMPFVHQNYNCLFVQICSSEPVYSQRLSHELLDLLAMMLQKDPQQRITCDEILNHPWLRVSFPFTPHLFQQMNREVKLKTEQHLKAIGVNTDEKTTISYQIVSRVLLNQTLGNALAPVALRAKSSLDRFNLQLLHKTMYQPAKTPEQRVEKRPKPIVKPSLSQRNRQSLPRGMVQDSRRAMTKKTSFA